MAASRIATAKGLNRAGAQNKTVIDPNNNLTAR
jgi:hypothetical protein